MELQTEVPFSEKQLKFFDEIEIKMNETRDIEEPNRPRYKKVLGKDLKIGDIMEVWWEPNHDTITNIRYRDEKYKINVYKGFTVAEFAINRKGMTIFPDEVFDILIVK